MMYMSVSIISIMIVGMCLLNSTEALAAVGQRESSVEPALCCLRPPARSTHLPHPTQLPHNNTTGFAHLEDGRTSLLMPKAIYVAVNCAFLGLGLWKCGKLGLLPTTSADWVSYVPPAAAGSRAEVSGVPL